MVRVLRAYPVYAIFCLLELGNVSRIIESVRIAKAKGARLRTGPELEITGETALFKDM